MRQATWYVVQSIILDCAKNSFRDNLRAGSGHRNYESTRSRKISIKPRVKFTMLLTRGRLQRRRTISIAPPRPIFRPNPHHRFDAIKPIILVSLLTLLYVTFWNESSFLLLIPFGKNGIIPLSFRYHRCYIRTMKTEGNFCSAKKRHKNYLLCWWTGREDGLTGIDLFYFTIGLLC